MKFQVSVTRHDIERGIPGDAFCCPVMLACLRSVPMALSASPWSLEVGTPNQGFVELPPEVTNWMEQFDGGRPVEPFEFEIEIPEFV